MKPSTLVGLLAGHAKAAAVVAAATALTAGGSLAVASVATSGNTHAAAGLATAHAAVSSAPEPDSTEAPGGHGHHHSVTTTGCAGNFSNHGQYVSSIAQTTPAPSASPNAHGQAVSAAARSGCFKPSTAATGKPDTLPAPANSHATDHPTGPPSSHPDATDHPSGPPSGVPSHD